MVYLALASYAGCRQITPSHATLAKIASMSERSVRTHLDTLRDRQLVEWKTITTATGKHNVYRLLTSWTGVEGPAMVAGGVRQNSTEGPATVAGEVDSEVDKKNIKSSRTSPKRSRPADWKPNANHLTLAKNLGVSTAGLVEQFCDHHDSKGNMFASWDLAFNTWIRNSAKFGASATSRRVDPAPAYQETAAPAPESLKW